MEPIVLDGETGLIVPPENPRALATAILKLLEDPGRARAMGEAGRQRVEEFFSLSQRMLRLEAIYAELVGEQSPDAAPEDMRQVASRMGS